MTLSEFRLLDNDARYLAWLSIAVEVASFESLGFIYNLYQLDDFYIEIRFLQYLPENVVFVAFQDSYKLDPYLERIDISGIFN